MNIQFPNQFAVIVLIVLATMSVAGCYTRNLAPEAKYDDDRVKVLREDIDRALQE